MELRAVIFLRHPAAEFFQSPRPNNPLDLGGFHHKSKTDQAIA